MRGLTLSRILEKTTASRIQLAAYVVVKNLKFGVSKKLGIPKAIAQTYSKDRDKDGRPKVSKYTTMIEFYPENKVKVACSCEDHLYRWEYALYRKNASYITYSNGEPPVDTNPKLVAGACKHVVKLAMELKRQKLLPK
jgi:hypothetical protein